jgi:hypothetical protein
MSSNFPIFQLPVSAITTSETKTFGSSKLSLSAWASGTGTYKVVYSVDVTNFDNPSESQWILDAAEDEVSNTQQSSGFGFLEQAWEYYRIRITAFTGTATFQVYGKEQ